MNKQRIQWIESLKFCASLVVFLGHFYMTFYKSRADIETVQGASRFIVLAFDNIFHIIVEGNFMVFIFCLLGGFFAAHKRIETISGLIKAIFKRYVRFVIPIFFTNVIALIIQETIGFHTQEWATLINSVWVGQAYPVRLSFLDVIKSALLLTHQFSGPFWVIRPFFYGSVVVYFYKYIMCKTEKSKLKFLPDVMMFILLWLFYVVPVLHNNFYHAAFFAVGGVLLKKIIESIYVPKELLWLPATVLITVVLTFDVYPNMTNDVRSILAFFTMISVFCIEPVKKCLECKLLLSVNSLSFGVFALHGPILFSFSILLQEFLMNQMSYSLGIMINIILSTLIVIFAALLFNKTVQPIVDFVLPKICIGKTKE